VLLIILRLEKLRALLHHNICGLAIKETITSVLAGIQITCLQIVIQQVLCPHFPKLVSTKIFSMIE
jgi:hypothetical protein